MNAIGFTAAPTPPIKRPTTIATVLNTGEGDMKLTFDLTDPGEAIRAERIIRDMLTRGYALVAKGEDGTYSRVKSFDGTKSEFTIVDFDPTTGDNKRVRSDKADATAVAPTGGG